MITKEQFNTIKLGQHLWKMKNNIPTQCTVTKIVTNQTEEIVYENGNTHSESSVIKYLYIDYDDKPLTLYSNDIESYFMTKNDLRDYLFN